MARKTWKLTPSAREQVEFWMMSIKDQMEDMREAFEKQPEWWRESDEGNTVLEWLDTWDNLISDYEEVDKELTDITGKKQD